MRELNAETFVASDDPTLLARTILMRVKHLCRRILTWGGKTSLEFSNGQALIRNVDNGLLIWISAQDILDFYGIRTVLAGYIYPIAAETDIHWIAASKTPFQKILDQRHQLRIRIGSELMNEIDT